MNIYAIHDRLIDHWRNPFCAPNDGEVMTAVANLVNKGDTSDLAQAPHHFEIWKLGEVQINGHLAATHELVCDCSALVRTTGPTTQPADRAIQAAHARIRRPVDEAPGASNAGQRPPASQA